MINSTAVAEKKSNKDKNVVQVSRKYVKFPYLYNIA